MMKQQTIKSMICALLMIMASAGAISAQTGPQVSFAVGALVLAEGPSDSVYSATADVIPGDSLDTYAIRVVSIDSLPAFDQQYVIDSLPLSYHATAWKEGNTIHISLPNHNPYVRRKYMIELLSEGEVLLMQIEKEF